MTDRTAILSRMFVVFGLFLLIPCVLAFQLFRLNYLNGSELRALWSQQAIDSIPIPAQRGNIYDANGTLLATNAANYQIALDPKIDGLTQKQINQLTKALSQVTNEPVSSFNSKIKSAPTRSRYVVLAKNLSPIGRDVIKNLNIRGVIIEESFRRVYTFGSLAAHTLGFVNYNLDGRIGLEAYYNDKLQGEDGVQQVRRDPRNKISAYIGAPKKLPKNGNSLHTTIDSYIQAILEDELENGVKKTSSIYGTGIIIDPRTGAIKAMANYPTYDPNFPGNVDDINRRNFAISDMVEPGSTFKLVTAIAAVEQDVVDFNEIFKTPANGEVQIHGLTLRDHDPLGDINFQQVIQKSSNVATAEIAMRLKPQVFYQYVRNLGFGSVTQIDLSGEVTGSLKKPYDWSLVSLPWMSHGYEILATPIQIAQAYAAFANDGVMMRPYLVDNIQNENGKVIFKNKPTEIRRVAKHSTLEQLLPVFESVVSDSGTGNSAQIDGLRIAGKTGTAKKVVNGRYSNNYLASFVGFFPVEDPSYVCLILLNEPKTSGYGGVVAAPIFRETTKRIAGLDNEIQRNLTKAEVDAAKIVHAPYVVGLERSQTEQILKELNIPYKFIGKSGYVVAQSIDVDSPLKPGEKIELTLSKATVAVNGETEGFAEIPDLRGMNMRAANNLLFELGLKSKMIGSGTVYAQFPLAGQKMRLNNTVTLRGKAKSLEILSQADTK